MANYFLKRWSIIFFAPSLVWSCISCFENFFSKSGIFSQTGNILSFNFVFITNAYELFSFLLFLLFVWQMFSSDGINIHLFVFKLQSLLDNTFCSYINLFSGVKLRLHLKKNNIGFQSIFITSLSCSLLQTFTCSIIVDFVNIWFALF